MNQSCYGTHLSSLGTAEFFVSQTEHTRGQITPKHLHKFGCIHFVTSGLYREQIGRSLYEIKPGEILFKKPGILHSNEFKNTNAKTLRIQLFEFERYDVSLPAGPFKLHHPRISDMFLQLRTELVNVDEFTNLAVESLTWQILCELGRVDRRRATGRHQVSVGSVMEQLRDEFISPPSVSSLAVSLGIHRSQLARSFKAQTGLTISDFLRNVRIEKAIELLENTNLSMVEIALSCGFSDQSHFSRTFRRTTSKSPSEWRR